MPETDSRSQTRRGLSAREAAERLSVEGPNALPELERRTALRIMVITPEPPRLQVQTRGFVTGFAIVGLSLSALAVLLYVYSSTRRASRCPPRRWARWSRCSASPPYGGSCTWGRFRPFRCCSALLPRWRGSLRSRGSSCWCGAPEGSADYAVKS